MTHAHFKHYYLRLLGYSNVLIDGHKTLYQNNSKKNLLESSANFRCPKAGKYHHVLKGEVLSHKAFWVLAKNLLRGNLLVWRRGWQYFLHITTQTSACAASPKSNSLGKDINYGGIKGHGWVRIYENLRERVQKRGGIKRLW